MLERCIWLDLPLNALWTTKTYSLIFLYSQVAFRTQTQMTGAGTVVLPVTLHPRGVPVQVLWAALLIPLPDNALGKDGLNALASAPTWEPQGSSSLQLWPGPALATAPILGVNQQMEALTVTVSPL